MHLPPSEQASSWQWGTFPVVLASKKNHRRTHTWYMALHTRNLRKAVLVHGGDLRSRAAASVSAAIT